MVIISSGIPAKPITPRIMRDGRIFGMTAIRAIDIDLNTIKKRTKIIVKTVNIVCICDENKL
tara:strand:+ start:306 stop:491 length:186 start_codon:yes stop_codon:yes gene_type:complete